MSTLTPIPANADHPVVDFYPDLQQQEGEEDEILASLSAMPWFKSFRLKRKRKVRKQDISEPKDFKHCYHAVYDRTAEDYSGLPPQWSDLVTSPQSQNPKESLLSRQDSQKSVEKTVVCVTPDCKKQQISLSPATTVDIGKENEKNSELSLLEGTLKPSSNGSLNGSEKGDNISLNRVEQQSVQMRPKKSSIDSTSSLTLTKRPSPIIRGSDDCLDETIKYIRKVYRSSSQDNDPTGSGSGQSSLEHPVEEEFIDIHYGSRSRANSMLQLRTSPINRGRIVSYHAGSTGAMSHSNDRLPSEFCLSAPHDVVRSDLGLYDCENASECSTSLSHTRINSPSGSSGYFGSTMSSLYSSRMSSSQQISPGTQQPVFSPTRPLHSYERVGAGGEHPEMVWGGHPQIPHGSQHRFSSLQRPSKRHREPYIVRHTAIGPTYSNNFSVGHYGTTPRYHKPLRELRSVGGASGPGGRGGGAHTAVASGMGTGLDSLHRVHEQAGASVRRGGEIESESSNSAPHHFYHHQQSQPQAVASSRYGNFTNTAPSSNNSCSSGSVLGVQKRERRSSPRMSNEQFRATLEFLVDSGDPTKDLTDFIKIGEGSTGCVYKARQISRNRVVAVKKMNLWKQQRRELLFNEVSKKYGLLRVECIYVVVLIFAKCCLFVHLYMSNLLVLAS